MLLPGIPKVSHARRYEDIRKEIEPVDVRRLSHAERYAIGKEKRKALPRGSHAAWKPPANRPDPVELVLESEKGRLQELLPLRHGRMVRSAFTFYRGAALTMASDLASTPTSGIRVQCCGDAHLCNFGGFATPERNVIFAINDLDETLPAPWEWDVKRLSASFVVACRDNGLSDAVARDVVMTCVRTYRQSMAEFGQMKTLELWYSSLDADDLVADIPDPVFRRRALKRLQKERARSIAEDIFPKLVEHKETSRSSKISCQRSSMLKGILREKSISLSWTRSRGTATHYLQAISRSSIDMN